MVARGVVTLILVPEVVASAIGLVEQEEDPMEEAREVMVTRTDRAVEAAVVEVEVTIPHTHLFHNSEGKCFNDF